MKTYKLMLLGTLMANPASVLTEPLGSLGAAWTTPTNTEPFQSSAIGWTTAVNMKEESVFDVPHKNEAIMTIRGKVQGMKRELSFSREWPDTSMRVQTENGIVTVILGPAWFLSQRFPKILLGDEITVEGSRILYRNVDTILAGEVGKGNEVLKLRDKNGRPLWIL